MIEEKLQNKNIKDNKNNVLARLIRANICYGLSTKEEKLSMIQNTTDFIKFTKEGKKNV